MDWDHPVILGIIAGTPAVLVGWWGYLRSKRKSAVTEKLGVESGSAQSIEQALDGMNNLVASLHAYIVILKSDATVAREDIARLTNLLTTCSAELHRMHQKYGNGQQAIK